MKQVKKQKQDYRRFFSKESDKEFKKSHPKSYWGLVTLGIAAFTFPMFVFLILTMIFDAGPNRWEIAVGYLSGYIGCFAIGVGLFNIVAALVHQYLGHKLTAICCIGGAVLVALGTFFLYFT